jgi:hypothetical protein
VVAVGSDPAFTRHVDDIYHRDLDGLFSAGEMVRALVSHPTVGVGDCAHWTKRLARS